MLEKVYILIVSLLATAGVLCTASCDSVVWGADIKSYVDAGLSNIFVRNYSYSLSTANGTVPSGVDITVTVSVVNPDHQFISVVTACAGHESSLNLQEEQLHPPDFTIFTFTFNAPEYFERTTLPFTVSFHNTFSERDYLDLPVPVRVDSPPDTPVTAIASFGPDSKSFVAFLLPEGYRNEDIVSVQVTATSETAGTSPKTARLTVQQDGNWVRWYPPGAATNDGYTYSFVCIDAVGLESEASAAFEQDDRVLVFYNANGGTGLVMDPAGYDVGVDVTLLPATALSREGYAFTAWNSAEDGSGNPHTPGEAVPMKAGGLEFWAQWTPVEYTVHLELAGGLLPAGLENPFTYTIEDETITLSLPARPGYSFDGWYDNASGTGTAITEIPAGSTGDKTYYAQWVELAGVTINMDVSGQALVFTNTTMSLAPNSQLQISCTNSALAAGGSNWVWRIDGARQTDQNGSSFTWTPPINNIGQYVISCEVTYQGLVYSGSVTVTVDYQ